MASEPVKKIKPYPFAIQLESEALAQPAKGQVIKLASHGLILETQATPLAPGDLAKLTFEIPGLHASVETQSVVIKVFNQIQAVQRIELHFKNLTHSQMSAVSQFLIQTGQAKRVS